MIYQTRERNSKRRKSSLFFGDGLLFLGVGGFGALFGAWLACELALLLLACCELVLASCWRNGSSLGSFLKGPG